MFIVISLLLNDIIFLPTLPWTFNSRSISISDSSTCSIFIIYFGLFNNWLNPISMPRNNSFLWRRNILLYSILIDCLRVYCGFSDLAIGKCYWCFARAIRDDSTWWWYIPYMWVIILGMIRIRIINILSLFTILKWNIRSLFRYLNRLNLRCRNINIINLVCNILLILLFLFYYVVLNGLFFIWRFILLFYFRRPFIQLRKFLRKVYFLFLNLLGYLSINIWIYRCFFFISWYWNGWQYNWLINRNFNFLLS